MKKVTTLAISLAGVLSAAAIPEVSNVRFSQDASRTVTITYDLTGGPAIVTCDILTNAVDAASGASIGDENLHFMYGDVNCRVNGEAESTTSHTITWQADKAWPDHKITTESVRAKVTAWALDNPPEYMVVDLLTHDIAYYTSTNAFPGGLLEDEAYRTTRLVMKHVHAPECGSFVAGNLAEPGHRTEEVQHRMVLTNDYWLGVFEFTQGQYLQVMGSWPSSKSSGDLRRLLPVDHMTFNGLRGSTYPSAPSSGVLYALSVAIGYDMDFPSEAQREYAARAGNVEGYWPNGVPISTTVATTSGTSEPTLDGMAWEYCTTSGGTSTMLVGTKASNSWGFYDVLGNVNEYCLDFYKASRTDADGHVITSAEADDSTKVAARGGCCWDQWYNCRVSRRQGYNVSTLPNSDYVGLRPCCPIMPRN